MNAQHRINLLESAIRRTERRAVECDKRAYILNRFKDDEEAAQRRRTLLDMSDHYVAVAHGRRQRLAMRIGT